MYCKHNQCDYIKGYRVHGERRTKVAAMDTKRLICDSSVSDYVFMMCSSISWILRLIAYWKLVSLIVLVRSGLRMCLMMACFMFRVRCVWVIGLIGS